MWIYWFTKHRQFKEGRELDVARTKDVSCRGQRESRMSPDFPLSLGELQNPFSFSLDFTVSCYLYVQFFVSLISAASSVSRIPSLWNFDLHSFLQCFSLPQCGQRSGWSPFLFPEGFLQSFLRFTGFLQPKHVASFLWECFFHFHRCSIHLHWIATV